MNGSAQRFGVGAAVGTLLGILLSGPTAVALVNATHPQPPWRDAQLFAERYHPVQMLPYAGGIVLVASLVMLISSLHALAGEAEKPRTTAALVFTATFAVLIFFNYVVQMAFVPELARHQDDASAPFLAAFSMSKPTSLAWGIEMWGWGFLGAATWLAAAVFHGSRLERAAAAAFVANGPVSILGALLTAARPGWVMSTLGMVLGALWNLLLAAMAALALVALRRRLPATPAWTLGRSGAP